MATTIQSRGALTLGTDWSGCTADHSPLSSIEGKHHWSGTSSLSYNFVVCATSNLPLLFSSESARFEVLKETVLLGCYALSTGMYLTSFCRIVLSSSSGRSSPKREEEVPWSFETSVSLYQTRRCNVSEDRVLNFRRFLRPNWTRSHASNIGRKTDVYRILDGQT